MINQIILATHNPDKRLEIAALLSDLGITVRSLAEFPQAPVVDEDGTTCEANAIKKAKVIADYTGLMAVADDTGLEVDALGGRPGVHAARYAGAHVSYEDNWRKLLLELDGVPLKGRGARFLTVVAIASPLKQHVDTVEGVLNGLIAERPAGTGGFGYDPVFLVPELGKTLAELTPTEKNRISHRAQAFAKAKAVLQQLDKSVQAEA
ncbi:RdgB/HAM1 family non-canonical purine NTP pyrophosphatase [Nitrospira sp. Nam74]